ncbi:response regulator [Actinoplanes sp. NPDC051851]|uniref:response regulator transcription factor n=1 Tax=Actinoplanes sp. NPDC051851 TaxID=3154753 RepID=UPI003418726E
MTTVLIADDEVDHRELLTLALRRAGYEVVSVANAAAAVDALGRGGIDAALIDVRMPGRSGIELCRDIRGNPATESLPIMVISADVHRNQIMAALHAGADDYLTKPFGREDLAQRLAHLLRRPGSEALRSAASSRAALLAARHAASPATATRAKPWGEVRIRRTA